MRNILRILFISVIIIGCNTEKTDNKYPEIKSSDWKNKQVHLDNFDDLIQGKNYLPVYSHTYYEHEHRVFDLTITVSIRNISPVDSIYILKADYFNTVGQKIREYIKKPIYLKPLETIEIIIEEKDVEGGSGANFVFDWAKENAINPPLFEAVMISTRGQQGLSFTTRGVPIVK